MSRRIARENTFKLVFEYLFSGEENEISFTAAVEGSDDADKDYLDSIYHSVLANSETVAKLVGKYSREFSFDRIFKVDLAILYVAICEILYAGIPYQVAVNEAIELAKKYSTEKSPTYINGVLAGILKDSEVSLIAQL